jgi:hypothetical protein
MNQKVKSLEEDIELLDDRLHAATSILGSFDNINMDDFFNNTDHPFSFQNIQHSLSASSGGASSASSSGVPASNGSAFSSLKEAAKASVTNSTIAPHAQESFPVELEFSDLLKDVDWGDEETGGKVGTGGSGSGEGGISTGSESVNGRDADVSFEDLLQNM